MNKIRKELWKMKKKISSKYLLFFYTLFSLFLLASCGSIGGGHSGNTGTAVPGEDKENGFAHPYSDDDRLEFLSHEAFSYSHDANPTEICLSDENGYLYSCQKTYTEEEMSEFHHAIFDEQNRLVYMLGYTPSILKENLSYCEEQIYERNDAEHTCRHIYYKANSVLLDSRFYVAYREMFDVNYYQFTEDGRLLSWLMYSPIIDSSRASYYSEELYFNRGYQASFDDGYLMSEILCYDYWGTNESGSWEHRAYQYNEKGDCILKIITTEDDIKLYCYEYDTTPGQIDAYTYLIKEDWELLCNDGSTYYFHAGWGDPPAIKKVSPDGRTELELFYGRTCDIGQQHILDPQEIEDSVNVHKYTVQPGDSLWQIAKDHYGYGSYSDILYRQNRSLIGNDPNMVLPGLRLYMPEIGTTGNT